MTREIIDAIASDDNLSAEAQFKSSISTKVGDALEIRRKEVANTMFTHISHLNKININQF